MKSIQILSIVWLIAVSSCHQAVKKPAEIIDLSGTWAFELDPPTTRV